MTYVEVGSVGGLILVSCLWWNNNDRVSTTPVCTDGLRGFSNELAPAEPQEELLPTPVINTSYGPTMPEACLKKGNPDTCISQDVLPPE